MLGSGASIRPKPMHRQASTTSRSGSLFSVIGFRRLSHCARRGALRRSALGLRRVDERQRRPAMLSIDQEIGVERQDGMPIMDFRHPDDAGVGQRHRRVPVFLDQFAQRADMLEHLPPPALDMWTGFGEQAFKDYSAEVVVAVGAR